MNLFFLSHNVSYALSGTINDDSKSLSRYSRKVVLSIESIGRLSAVNTSALETDVVDARTHATERL